LNRAGVVGARGFLAACVHGEYESLTQQYQLHFHGICAGEKLKALDGLRNRQGFVRNADIHRPIVVSPISDDARQISYLMQPFWPKKARIPMGDENYKRVRSKSRIDEPFHSLYLLWLDKWSVSDIWLFSGIRISGGLMTVS
jgi:hypothetical protein